MLFEIYEERQAEIISLDSQLESVLELNFQDANQYQTIRTIKDKFSFQVCQSLVDELINRNTFTNFCTLNSKLRK